MIKSLYLEGFKSFGKPVQIDFRDITLLYGENSSGKSSILQALQYAREIFCHGNLDCLKTEIGGDFVNLRGFDNFSHGRNRNGTVTIGIKVAIPGPGADKFHNFGNIGSYVQLASRSALYEPMKKSLSFALDRSRWLENENQVHLLLNQSQDEICVQLVVSISRSTESGKLRVSTLHLNIDSLPMLQLSARSANSENPGSLSLEERFCISVWTKHPLFPEVLPDIEKWAQASDLGFDFVDWDQHGINRSELRSKKDDEPSALSPDDAESPEELEFGEAVSAGLHEKYWAALIAESKAQSEMFGWRERIGDVWNDGLLTWTIDEAYCPSSLFTLAPGKPYEFLSFCLWDDPVYSDFDHTPALGIRVNLEDLRDFSVPTFYATAFLLDSLDSIQRKLMQMLYVGPLRRHYSAPSQRQRQNDHRSWADGLGAWDTLSSHPDTLPVINHWLTNENLFAFDCSVKAVTELTAEAEQELAKYDSDAIARLNSILHDLDASDQVLLYSPEGIRLHSTDLGVGFSQILPIIVAARGLTRGSILLEQPELHIHARLQAVLGDLLATGVEARLDGLGKRQFIVETHSEFLLLRLMRRIRETTKELPSDGPRLLCDNVAVYHISKREGSSVAKKIELDVFGNLTDEWPDKLFQVGFMERFGE